MLKAVSISNVAVIKDLTVEFPDGFTVITGETGAGKSVLLDSVAFCLGAKASKDIIRTGETRAEVTAVFDAPRGAESDDDGEITLYRSITDDGKSIAKINGKAVSTSVLRETAKNLMSIHGQQDSGALSEKSEIIKMLDEYVGLDGELAEYGEKYEKFCELSSRLSELKGSLKDKAMMLDILSYQLKEIDAAKLSDPDEEDKLVILRQKLRSLEKVSKNVSVVEKALVENEKGITAVYMLDRAASAIRQLSDVMPEAEATASRLEEIKYEVTTIADSVSSIIDDDDLDDPERKLDAVEKRLTLLKRIRSKYGETVSDVIQKRDEIKTKLSELSNSDDAIEDLENAIAEARSACETAADSISAKRRAAAQALTGEISSVLYDLDMPKVRFLVSVTKRIKDGMADLDRRGYDDVDFLVSANVGEEMQPISRIASGGELSRIMLAVKSSMQKDSGVTSVFDEIDAGVSGATSERIGRKLREMSRASQLICITHSAQIASLADTHFKISKSEKGGRVESSVEKLDRDGRIKELSRIIGGVKITKKVIDTAEEMLKKND